MLKEKTGRVTFMPLNRLKPKNPPAPNSQDAEPLLDKLKYDRKYEKAFQQVFGKTCVCRDLAIAAAYVKSHGINTITLDGDKVDRKGALTGGYHDVRRSRIEAIKGVKTWKGKYDAERARAAEVKAQIGALEQKITQAGGRMAVAAGQLSQLKESRERLLEEGAALAAAETKRRERVARLEGEKEELEGELRGLEAKIAGYTAELGTPMTHGLTREEEALVSSLGKEVEQRRKDMIELSKRKNEVRIFEFLL
jgi:structural maintenance of chromosome 3 (chondroitin sulfate proteoglycan 6)